MYEVLYIKDYINIYKGKIMMIVHMKNIYNEKGQVVGFVKNNTYYTERDYLKGQVYIYKYLDGIGISDKVIKQLTGQGVKKIVCSLKNFRNQRSLHRSVYIAFRTFLMNCVLDDEKMRISKDKMKNYDKVYICEIRYWNELNGKG